MIEHRVGDLLEQPDLTHIVHQANLYHTFGSGIAAQIKAKYPEAYAADCQMPYGDKSLLGRWSMARTSGPIVINLYSQIGIGGQDRRTSYDAMFEGLTRLRHFLGNSDNKLGIPHGMGCGLANGSWRVVSSIIEDVFTDCLLRVVICKLPLP